jgi:Cu/Ag efflux pump CusA
VASPLATAIIFGLMAAVPLVLLVLPALLALRSGQTDKPPAAG